MVQAQRWIFFGGSVGFSDFPLGNALRDLQLCGACGLDPCLPGQCVPQVSWPWPQGASGRLSALALSDLAMG